MNQPIVPQPENKSDGKEKGFWEMLFGEAVADQMEDVALVLSGQLSASEVELMRAEKKDTAQNSEEKSDDKEEKALVLEQATKEKADDAHPKEATEAQQDQEEHTGSQLCATLGSAGKNITNDTSAEMPDFMKDMHNGRY